jgi:hypothetical protein
VVRTDNFTSITRRVRAASTLLEVGEFLSPDAKTTGLFREVADADGHTTGEAPPWNDTKSGNSRRRLRLKPCGLMPDVGHSLPAHRLCAPSLKAQLRGHATRDLEHNQNDWFLKFPLTTRKNERVATENGLSLSVHLPM